VAQFDDVQGLKVVALAIGLFVTLFLGIWPFAFVWHALSAPWSADSLVQLLWGLAGLAGIVAFWVWMFSEKRKSLGKRVGLTVALFGGIGAVLPLLYMGGWSGASSWLRPHQQSFVLLESWRVFGCLTTRWRRTVKHRGPRLFAARPTWPAAQQDR